MIRSRRKIYILIVFISLIVVVVVVGQELASDRRVDAAPLKYSVSKYSEEEWLKLARDTAHGMGMVEKPQREQWALMTTGSYLTLQGGGGSPKDREAPLFIYKGFGNIPVLTVLGGGLDGPAKDMGGVMLIFDGNTGFISSWAAYPKDNVARGETEPDLSFIPVDSGFDPRWPNSIPTAAS